MYKRNPLVTYLMPLPMVIGMSLMKVKPISHFMMRKMAEGVLSPAQKRKAFAGYEATKHDVFVSTYAKSGTNWMMQIAQQIAYLGECDFDHIHDMVPWPGPPVPTFIPLENDGPQKNAPTKLRVIKSHLEMEYLPYNPEAKYIAVLRDPKDSFVSGYYFGHEIMNASDFVYSVEEWLMFYKENRSMFDSWAAHTASFWEWRNRDNVMLITFKELKEDLTDAVRRVAQFLEVDLTEEQLAKVVERSSFRYMKKHADKFAFPVFTFLGIKDEGAAIVREGKRGGAGGLLSREQQREIDAFCQAELKRLGSDFPYETYFEVVE
ncbi:MAG TPA: sulfotransferase domain-containing protein [Anaerolineae bacterium]|nr:sulfotransferase domain-containing protein [Anaerolineae bacterium]